MEWWMYVIIGIVLFMFWLNWIIDKAPIMPDDYEDEDLPEN